MYDFPSSPSPGDEYTPPVGGQTYIWQPPRWLVKGVPPAGGGGGGGIAEAPVDGKQYGRTDAAWSEVLANPTWATLTGKPSTFPPTVPIAWTDVSGKPATFPPTLPIAEADVTNLVSDLDGKAPAVHGHGQSDITGLVADLAGKEPVIAGGTAAQYWKGTKVWAALDKAAVGLGNVDNTSDAAKPISTAQATALAGKEPTITGGTTAQFWRGDKTWQAIPAQDWSSITGKPSTFPPTVPIAWTDVSGKPATFPPTLPIASSGITGLDAKQTEQDNRLSPIEVEQTTQNNRLTSIEGVNATQDTAIAAKLSDAPVDGSTYGRKNAAWVVVDATGVPTGAVMTFPATAAPTGYLKMNGALINRATYGALWVFAQASGNLVANDAAWTGREGSFSPGDGSTTFRIPDGRGEFERGWDDSRGIDAARVIGSAQAHDLASHGHPGSTASAEASHLHTATGYLTTGGSTAGLVRTAAGTSGVAFNTGLTQQGTPTITIAAAGGTETRPRNLALLKCIKY